MVRSAVLTFVAASFLTICSPAEAQFMEGFANSFNKSFERSKQRRYERELQEQRFQHQLEMEKLRRRQTQPAPSYPTATQNETLHDVARYASENLYFLQESGVYIITEDCDRHLESSVLVKLSKTGEGYVVFLNMPTSQCVVRQALTVINPS